MVIDDNMVELRHDPYNRCRAVPKRQCHERGGGREGEILRERLPHQVGQKHRTKRCQPEEGM